MAEGSADTAKTAPVVYRGGSAAGVFMESCPEVFFTHPQRELRGTDVDAPYELYRNRGQETVTVTVAGDDGEPAERSVKAWVFEFDSAAAAPRVDDEQNLLEGAPSS